MTPSGNSCSCTNTDCIGSPFCRTLPAMPRGGSWQLGTPGSAYYPPRPAPGEVTPTSLSQCRHNTGTLSPSGGFRACRSTIDIIFLVRQLQQKCQEQNELLFLAFMDLMKVFDLVSRGGLFQLLKKIVCPPPHSFCTGVCSTVSCSAATSDPFPINSGV